jgi:peptide/nickel transport system permease protein
VQGDNHVGEELKAVPPEGTGVRTRWFSRPAVRVLRYILSRLLTIFATIAIGVFVIVVISNAGGFVDDVVQQEVSNLVFSARNNGYFDNVPPDQVNQAVAEYTANLVHQYGLDLPFLPRHLRWTWNSLTFQWGEVLDQRNINFRSFQFYGLKSLLRYRVASLILQRLPNTLLLITSANFFVFLFGIPMALFLSRKYGQWVDKLFVTLSPISSVPSWVHGILLVILFAVQLRLLPTGEMFDVFPPATKWGYIAVVAKHMILPVTAIFLSIIFQCIYTWRTFFLIYANEDYVDLAKAKGLPNRLVEGRYILRPTLPYVITSFGMTLLGFWQMTTALEWFFSWPGIGMLYVEALGVYVTEVRTIDSVLIIAIVVVFSYLLGLTILLLDAAYALLDPRVRIGNQGQTSTESSLPMRRRLREWFRRTSQPVPKPVPAFQGDQLARAGGNVRAGAGRPRVRKFTWRRGWLTLREIARYPSALFGSILVLLLIGTAIYTVIAIPPAKASQLWYRAPTGVETAPKNASPVWSNWFRRVALPTTYNLDSRKGEAARVVTPAGDHTETTLTFRIDYPYNRFPQDLMVYFWPGFEGNQPFARLTWITPDGREFELSKMAVSTGARFVLTTDIPQRFILPGIRYSTPYYNQPGNFPITCAIFYDPQAEPCTPLPGTYRLRVDGVTFGAKDTLDAQVVLFGETYGIAGTDSQRRDLSIALLWGFPVALAYGLVGAVVTTLLSMLVAAAGVWYGGWVDMISQRITEANIILPILAIGVLVYYYYGISFWVILGVIVLLNVFGSTTKSYRAAFLQVKEAPYVEAAQAYNASDGRIILRYLVPRILPVLIPQLVALIPAYVFLEATLGIFGVGDMFIPTWGSVIHDALKNWAFRGNYYWIAEPVALLLVTGLAFAMFGFALDRILNPRLREE